MVPSIHDVQLDLDEETGLLSYCPSAQCPANIRLAKLIDIHKDAYKSLNRASLRSISSIPQMIWSKIQGLIFIVRETSESMDCFELDYHRSIDFIRDALEEACRSDGARKVRFSIMEKLASEELQRARQKSHPIGISDDDLTYEMEQTNDQKKSALQGSDVQTHETDAQFATRVNSMLLAMKDAQQKKQEGFELGASIVIDTA
eukprot:CAMPEP_0202479528 /NCGR_PEP_ID=MMETSP1360-20130828/95028_1 /ASSEMBLY_ACC=CAM_ASM_000848 /TAXON_ID=515479 /ORGANISM="Licmophora paradoxa, Strain CCMP2313" /LENGTH=202 /DNA_ID=CAMNT_0049106859 /DNA_START=411 /DNA_END=1019 /DNA_ORIENTATION=-